MNNSVIKTNELTKSFGATLAVDRLNLEVRQGELFGLVGPDGAGKTTTMRLLTGIMDPASGDAQVAGHSILSEGELIKGKIGYMSQRFGLYEDLTVMENILFYADLYEVPKRERPARVERLLGFSNLALFKDRLAGKLSGGMKQKLGLACTLIHTPLVLFLDEPTNGVDPVSRRDFWKLLYDLLKDGVTILVSTAYLDEAERCTRIALMHGGRILTEGEPKTIRASLGLWSSERGMRNAGDIELNKTIVKPAVKVDGLTRRFGDFTAVDGIDLEVAKGEIFGFLGPNGAGKSTTIRMLCGLLLPSGGTGSVGGSDIISASEEIKQNIGYMSQRFSLYDDLTVEENINFFSGIYNVPASKKEARKAWVLDMAALRDKRDAITRTLPAGYKQRLALGCAILHGPRILFLDEPTSGVDPISRRNFWALIHAMAKTGTTIFVTTHYMDEADYCDRLALIYRGKIIAEGTPSELKKNYMTYEVLEIEAEPLVQAMQVLEDQGVESAVFGSLLHATVKDAGTAIPLIQSALNSAGIVVPRIEKIEPSLEDVFVTLIESSRQETVDGRKETK